MNQELISKIIKDFSKDNKNISQPTVQFSDNQFQYLASPYRVVGFANSNGLNIDLPERNLLGAIQKCKGDVVTINLNVNQWVNALKKVNVTKVKVINIIHSLETQQVNLVQHFKDVDKCIETNVIDRIELKESFDMWLNPKYLKHALDMLKKMKCESVEMKFNKGEYPMVVLKNDDIKYLIMGVVAK